MDQRRVGTSGLKVSEIGLGCNNFGMRIDQARTETVVAAALDAGITLFDTADIYGGQKSEVMLGKALGKRRADVVVATKFAMPMGERLSGGSRRYVMGAVEASLKRLGTDWIDLYQMHTPDPETPIEETLDALDDIVRAGKARYVGCSNFAGWQIADAHWIARVSHRTHFISAQNLFNILERRSAFEVVPACERFGLGLLPYFPLASGLLSGKYARGAPAPEGTRLAVWGARGQAALSEANFARLEKLTAWAAERDKSLLELAFAWLLGHAVVPSVIAGATSADQIRANAAAGGWKLTDAEIAEVAELAK